MQLASSQTNTEAGESPAKVHEQIVTNGHVKQMLAFLSRKTSIVGGGTREGKGSLQHSFQRIPWPPRFRARRHHARSYCRGVRDRALRGRHPRQSDLFCT